MLSLSKSNLGVAQFHVQEYTGSNEIDAACEEFAEKYAYLCH